MKFKRGNKYRSGLLAAGALSIVAALILIFLLQGKGSDVPKAVNTALDGVNLIYFDFDKNNQKRMEIRCRESERHGPEQTLMKKITATIYRSGNLDKDIQVTAESGAVSRNFYNFEIRDQARIFSSDFSLSGQSFILENRELLRSRDPVAYELENISGSAAAGLEYFLDQGIFKLFETRGTMVRNGQQYAFYAQTLWVIKKSNLIIFQNRGEMTGAGTTIRGDWFSLQFDRDFANLQAASVSGNCFFTMAQAGANGRGSSKEIRAGFIHIAYDAAGRLQQIIIHDAGKITLQDGKNRSRIESDKTEIFLRPETQSLEKVKVLTRGTLTSRGTDNITVSADMLGALYSSEGQLTWVEAENNCEFRTSDLRGTAETLSYDAQRFLIDISGRDAAITSKKNVFHSGHFLVHSRKGQLNSNQSVKATIVPDKKSVLLSSKPLFVTASAMEMTDRGNVIRFRDKVKLFQDDIELRAGEMFLDGRKNRMSFSGGADLKFLHDSEVLLLRGQAILFDPSERQIVITGNASLNQGENVLGGRQIELLFANADRLEKILARDKVTFHKKDLSGKSGLLHWDFDKKIMLFKDSAQISRKGAGTTKGRELLLNLSSNEITVSSQEDRAETTINTDRP